MNTEIRFTNINKLQEEIFEIKRSRDQTIMEGDCLGLLFSTSALFTVVKPTLKTENPEEIKEMEEELDKMYNTIVSIFQNKTRPSADKNFLQKNISVYINRLIKFNGKIEELMHKSDRKLFKRVEEDD